MALLNRANIASALTQLGEMALNDGETVELLLVGGAVMVMEFESRQSTRDLDGIVVNSIDSSKVRHYAESVAISRNWPADWLNDAAKGFIIGETVPTTFFTAPGIHVMRPSFAQLLAMKLCAWRDDIDIADAQTLLSRLPGNRDETWILVEPHLQPGKELKARYAFDDLWEAEK